MAGYSQVNRFDTPGGSIRDGAQTPMHELQGGGDYNSAYPPTSDANSAFLPENEREYAYSGKKSAAASNKKKWIIGGVLAAIVVLIIVIAVPVAVTQSNSSGSNSQNDSADGGSDGSGGGNGNDKNNPLAKVAQYGADGSTITMENGNQFTYQNKHGGFWVSTPGNNSAQAQNYSPPISETWDYVKNRILGVNLGGWLVIEPFIVPALFEPFANTSNVIYDEYGLSQHYLENGGQANLEKMMRQHYDTFITEQDFAEIAGAGLNWIRLPVGYWAVETYEGDTYLKGVAWEYVVKAIGWARKYGIRINLDLHAVPGSQNGNNHSGHQGVIGWLLGTFGYGNAERTLNIIRAMTEFVSQPEVAPVVPFFSVMNEPQLNTIGIQNAMAFFGQVYTMMRGITGIGKGVGPYMMLHSGFVGDGVSAWSNYLRGSDRVAYDFHPYLAFNPPYSDSWRTNLPKPCQYFGPNEDSGLVNTGVTVSGEWSLAINDCALYLNNVNEGYRYEGTYDGGDGSGSQGSCSQVEDYESFSDSYKANMKSSALGWMDALHHQFFWTWTIGNSTVTGKPSAPFWNYKLGIQQGWMPDDPNSQVVGACQSIGSSLGVNMPSTSWGSTFSDWMTGATTASYYANPSEYNPWPIASVSSAGVPVSEGPSLTATGDPSSLRLTTGAPTSITASTKGQTFPTLSAWFNDQDTAAAYTEIAGCNYPSNVYSLNNYDASGWPCSGGGNSKRQPTPVADQVKARTLTTPAPVARGPASVARDY